MTKEELDELRAMTRGELDERRAQAAAARQRKEEELRDWVPPVYFTQREINAQREYMRQVIEALAAYEREIGGEIFARIVASWPRLK
jgi:dephospho-CoA kinase